MFGYLGSNGAGKTTTIRILLDLIRATSGEISIMGNAWIKTRSGAASDSSSIPTVSTTA